MNKKTVRDIQVRGQRVLVRADFNVPLNEAGEITDDTRIRAALPTIEYLRNKGAKVILCSHMGRPKGKVLEELRLTPVAKRLSELLGAPVVKTDDCVGGDVERVVAAMEPGDVILLENLRFHAEETANDPAFAKQLAALAHVYVNDAFGTDLNYRAMSVAEYRDERIAELGEFMGNVIAGIYEGIRNGAANNEAKRENGHSQAEDARTGSSEPPA